MEKNTEQALELLTKELADSTAMLDQIKKDHEQQYTDLHTHYAGVKADSDDLKAAVKKHADDYADLTAKMQAVSQAVDQVKKDLDSPIYKGGKDLEDNDRKAAIECQRRAHIFKGGHPDEFKADLDNLVDPANYRSAVNKLMRVGIDSKRSIISSFTDMERKAFEASSLDSAFFIPEMLGQELDCTIECAEMLDLYDDVTVSRSGFMYPRIRDWGDQGTYTCDASCGADVVPEGNITWENGKTYDFRGAFCFQRKVLQEANYPLLDFMMRGAARSYRINRNRALISGDGKNAPLGWLTADCFPKIATPGQNPNHQDIRRFIASFPVERGVPTTIMHQNVFAYFAAAVDSNGRFIFGDGQLTYNPDDTRERIRISNCLPDPTEGGTKGDTANPFDAGDFIAATGAWNMAYSVVNKRPMFIEQRESNSTSWCVAYEFGAEDGGFVKCCEAARILVAGAAPVIP